MHVGTLRALEFDRIAAVVRSLAVTSTGQNRLAELHPATDADAIRTAQRETSEGTRFLLDHPGFPLRAPADLDAILDAIGVESRPLEPLRLLGLADYLESIGETRRLVSSLIGSFPLLKGLVEPLASFSSEIGAVRRAIDAAGDVVDSASPALHAIRTRLRNQRAKLRATLEGFLRGRETAKYLQDQIVTDRNGRYVLVVRAEHRSAIPGIVHGASASGASLYLEPLNTVEVNNDVVALEEQEQEEVRRILLALTDAFRARSVDLARATRIATTIDVIQARARFSLLVEGVEPVFSADGAIELRNARHPLLMRGVQSRLADALASPVPAAGASEGPVPVEILLLPPVTMLVIAGPNTGGKTVALKTIGLLAAMAQAGLHVPADEGSRLPVFHSIFADIGDEQSIAANLSTFSAHISHLVAMERDLDLPALVLLDEVGAGTDPAEGGALGVAVIDHFRRRGAHLIATTHYDALKSYAATTPGVAGAAFGFDPRTFAPTYRIVYGSPGRSLAIEIANRLGMPASVIAAARANLTEPERQLADHLARMDHDLRALEQDRQALARDRAAVTESSLKLRGREEALREREDRLKRRQDAKLDDRLREARAEIEIIIDGLKAKAASLSDQAAVRLRSGDRLRVAGVSTGETGAARAEARAALDRAASRFRGEETAETQVETTPVPTGTLEPGARVLVGGLGLEGVVMAMHGGQAEVDVRGKRLRAAADDLRVLGSGSKAARVSVSVDLQPREGSLTELNIIGETVDDAIIRLGRFLDASIQTDLRELRIVHGHGTGQLRRAVAAYLKEHPLVDRFETAPQNQGGGGATVVTLKD